MRLVFGKDRTVAKWVAGKIPALPHSADAFGPCTAIGVVDKNENELFGIVFHDYQPAFSTIQMSCGAASPRWATKNMVRMLLAYPFEQLKVRKLWSAIQHTNERTLKVAKGLGFKREAVLAHHFGSTHAVIVRLYAEDYRRIYGVRNGR